MTDTLFDLAAGPGGGCQVPDHLRPRPRPTRDLRLVFELAVKGDPGPQGSKDARAIYKGRGKNHVFTGRVALVERSKKVKPWRQTIVDTVEAMADRPDRLDGLLYPEMVFTRVRPLSHYRTGRNAHLLRDNAPAQPISAPDLSKLARSTEDALTDARVWLDDARVCEYLRLAKVWASEDPDALDSPGVVIRIYQLGANT